MVLGIDFGTKNLGFALSDESETIAEPFSVVTAKNTTNAVRAAVKQLQKVKILYPNKEYRIVLGVPNGVQQQPTQSFVSVQEFAQMLRQHVTESVILWDETYSTYIARRSKLLSGNEHAKAATVILQSYLNNNDKSNDETNTNQQN